MSSGVVFKNVKFSCSNYLAVHILDLCIANFSNTDGCEKHPHILEFFKNYRATYFSGLYIYIREKDFTTKEEYLFLENLFKAIREYALSPESDIKDVHKEQMQLHFIVIINELNAFASELT